MMLMWGSSAAADQADTARDRRDQPGVARAQQALDCLVELRTSLPGTPFATMVPDDLALPAMCAVYEAETRRCAGDQPPADEWGALAQACARADLVWEEHLALARQASRLCELGAPRAVAAVPMRRVHGFACREGAETLRQLVEDLARLGRIPLAETAVPAQRATPTGPFRSLTVREREILGHLVRGLTYAEIAGALFISEKTVSSHVSNLLRKTGTSSRAEVSALALRVEHAR
jgi:DNA-binding CsgD family transcriptional regulator